MLDTKEHKLLTGQLIVLHFAFQHGNLHIVEQPGRLSYLLSTC